MTVKNIKQEIDDDRNKSFDRQDKINEYFNKTILTVSLSGIGALGVIVQLSYFRDILNIGILILLGFSFLSFIGLVVRILNDTKNDFDLLEMHIEQLNIRDQQNELQEEYDVLKSQGKENVDLFKKIEKEYWLSNRLKLKIFSKSKKNKQRHELTRFLFIGSVVLFSCLMIYTGKKVVDLKEQNIKELKEKKNEKKGD